MKKLFFILASFALMTSAALAQSGKTYLVNPTTSKIEWTGYKPASSHSGTVGISKGSLTLKGTQIKGGTFTIDMNSIVDTDLQDASYRKMLEDHLKGEDFFHTATYPTATFVITEVKPLVGNANYNQTVSGQMTLRGVSKQVSFPAKVTQQGKAVTAVAEIKLDRTDFNVKYGSGKFFEGLGDKMIKDEMDLKVTLKSK